jgi:uncharacterized membrane protein YfcA
MDPTWYQYPLLFVVAAIAGAINAVAGGGTLLTFPALLWAGQAARLANATSTVALWPGQLGSLWGYRREVGPSHKAIGLLAVPSFLGGLAGAFLLLGTDDATFAALVPYLILTATLLFAVQKPLARWQRARGTEEGGRRKEEGGVSGGRDEGREARDEGRGTPGVGRESHPSPLAPRPSSLILHPSSFPLARWIVVLAFQFLVAVYGGYFGAGIGILMLAAFGFLGWTNIHRMNALKNINGMCINAVAAILFICHGLVEWRLASLMAAGSILGGYAGAGAAQRIGQDNVRRIVVLIGLGLTVAMFVRTYY